MLTSRTSLWNQKHRPLLWIAGACAWLVIDVWRAIREDSRPKTVTMSTHHPFVPSDLFSQMFEKERKTWTVGKGLAGPLASNPHGKLILRDEKTKRWLCAFGDKTSHSLLSLLYFLQVGIKMQPRSTEESRRTLFRRYFQATLAEASLQLRARGLDFEQTTPLLDRVATTFLESPLAELEHYQVFLTQDEEQRCRSLGEQAIELMGAHPANQKHFQAAHVLARLVVTVLVSELN